MECPKCGGSGTDYPYLMSTSAIGGQGLECNLCLGKGSLTEAQLAKRGYILLADKQEETTRTLISITQMLEALQDK